MFFRRQTYEKHSIVYKLGYASVDEVSEKIEDFLTSLKAEKDNILRIRLSVEEALLRWIDHCEPGTEFRLETGMQWNRPFIILKLWGPEYNPLIESRDESGVWVGELLGDVGLVPVYRYINSCNVIQLLLRRPRTNPGITLLAFAMAGTIAGFVLNYVLSSGVESFLTTTILTPFQDTFIRILNAVSAPVLFLSILMTVCTAGSISVAGMSGMKMISRFLLYSTVFTMITAFLCQPFFTLKLGAAALSRSEISNVLGFFLSIIPGDVLSPFIMGDFTQIIVVGLVIGTGLVLAGAKVQTLVTIIEEANTTGLLIAEWISDLFPGFVALLIVLGILNNTAYMLIGIWRPALLITVFSLLALFLRMLRIRLRFGVPLHRLWAKMRESFLLSLKTFSVETSFSTNLNCCEKKLGISRQLTSYGLPIGLICFMPVSTVASTILTLYSAECYNVPVSTVWMIMALFLAVTLAAAGPPMAGIGILTYTVMFGNLGIPAQALTIVLMGDIMMGFVVYPVNQAMLQLDLILVAEREKLLDRDVLVK